MRPWHGAAQQMYAQRQGSTIHMPPNLHRIYTTSKQDVLSVSAGTASRLRHMILDFELKNSYENRAF